MKPFVILFRQGPFDLTDAAKARRQAAISLWAREQNARGHRLEPRSLAPSYTRPGIIVADESVGQWPVTALLFLDARDLDEATAVAASHPAKDYNVAMEVRPWSAPTPARPEPAAIDSR
jgi:hypothetical protein